MTETPLDYVEEAGPGIAELPEGPQRPPIDTDGQGAVLQTYPGWSQETIEQFLQGSGAGIHMLIGAAERDWLLTSKDLERIAPPLTRICNRWEPALRLSPIADPLLLMHGLALYCWRSLLEAKRAQRDAEDAVDGEPVATYERGPAEPDAEIEPDEGEHPAQGAADMNGGASYFPESPRARSSE
jgi:hypothetical protein